MRSHRDQLRLALLVVDPALDHEDAVGHQQLARRRVAEVEHDSVARASPERSSRRGRTPVRVALACRRCLSTLTIHAVGDNLAVAPALDVGQAAGSVLRRSSSRTESSGCCWRRRGRGSPSRARAASPLLSDFLRRGSTVVGAASRLVLGRSSPRSKMELWPAEAIGDQAPARAEHVLEDVEHAPPRRAGRSEHAGLDKALQRPLVRLAGVDALAQKSRIDGNGPPSSRAARIRRTALSPTFFTASTRSGSCPRPRGSPRPETSALARLQLDRQLGAGGHVEGHLVLRVHHGGDQRCRVLGRPVRLRYTVR